MLRPHTLADFGDSAAMWGDGQVTRFIGGRPFTPEEVWSRLLRYAGHWALLGYGYWVVREQATGAFVGEVGYADFRRDVSPPLDAPEMGWVLSPAQQGKGYATEALQAALAWGAGHFGRTRAVCLIAPENAASLRVANKSGFRQTGERVLHGDPVLLLGRP